MDPDEITRFTKDLGSRKDPATRRRAREFFTKMGTKALPHLLKCLRNRDQGVRWEAGKILQTLKDPLAAPLLTEALKDDDFGVQWVAAGGLIALGRKGIIPLLQALQKDPESFSLRHGAHHVLQELARRGLLKAPLRDLLPELERLDGGLAIIPAAERALNALPGGWRSSLAKPPS